MRASARRPAVFLDRDGTLNREVDYLADPELFELLPTVIDGLLELQAHGFALVVVTNQSGIARGILDERTLAAIHRRMTEEVKGAGITFDWIGYCPHHPDVGEGYFRGRCSCRKPAPGLFFEAAARAGIDLERSWCIGDSLRDLAAMQAAGGQGVLVRTGKGAAQEAEQRRIGGALPPTFDDFGAAAAHITRSAGAESAG